MKRIIHTIQGDLQGMYITEEHNIVFLLNSAKNFKTIYDSLKEEPIFLTDYPYFYNGTQFHAFEVTVGKDKIDKFLEGKYSQIFSNIPEYNKPSYHILTRSKQAKTALEEYFDQPIEAKEYDAKPDITMEFLPPSDKQSEWLNFLYNFI